MKAWHFLKDDGRLRYTDQYPKVGETIKVDPDKLELCCYGLHASKNILDALSYSPGKVICRVELGGKTIKDSDKVCASERTILWKIDGEQVLRQFAIDCALVVIDDAPKEVVHFGMFVAMLYNENNFTAIEKDKTYSASYNAAYWAAYSAVDRAADSASYWAAYSASYWAAYSASYWAACSAADRAANRAADRASHRQLQEDHLLYLLEQAGWDGE